MSFEDMKPKVKPRIFWAPLGRWWICYEASSMVPHSRVGYGSTPSDAYRMWEAKT